MAAEPQVQARALGDPSRYRLFRYIADAPEPVTVAELAGYAGLNHNAIGQHLAVLKEARLLTADLLQQEISRRRFRPARRAGCRLTLRRAAAEPRISA